MVELKVTVKSNCSMRNLTIFLGLWFSEGDAIQFAFHQSGHHTKLCDTTDLPVGEWHKVSFAQYTEFGAFNNKLTINGSSLEGANSCNAIMTNTDPKTWGNVQVREEMKIKKIYLITLS